MKANLIGSAAFQMNGGTGVTARILEAIRRYGTDPRSMFEPCPTGGWLWTGPGGDYRHVTSTERDHILQVLSDGRA
jgi:hypothetical protein